MNFQTLDLNLLLVFDALMTSRSTTRAGESLFLTQSAASNALNRLRLAFGDPLFVKTPDGMMPTAVAESMAESIHSALLQLRKTIEDRGRFDPRTSTRRFRLCLTDVGQMVALPKLLRCVQSEAPEVVLETVAAPSHEMAYLMASGAIDLAAGVQADMNESMYSQRVGSERFVCLARLDHPRVQGKLSVDQFLLTRHAVFQPVSGNYRLVEEGIEKLAREKGVPRRVALRIAHAMGISGLINSSDLLIAVPRRLAQSLTQQTPLQVLELPFESPSIDIVQYWHKRLHPDPGHRWLRGLMASALAAEGAHENVNPEPEAHPVDEPVGGVQSV